MTIQIQYGNISIAQSSRSIPAEHLPPNETNYTPIAGDNYLIGDTAYMVSHLPTTGEMLDTLCDAGVEGETDDTDVDVFYSFYLRNLDGEEIYHSLNHTYNLPSSVKCEMVAAGLGDDGDLVLLAFSPTTSTTLCDVVGDESDCHIVVNKSLIGKSIIASSGNLTYTQHSLSRYVSFHNRQWCVDTATSISTMLANLPYDVDVYEKTEYTENLYLYQFSNGYSIREIADEMVGGLEVLNSSGQTIRVYYNGESEIYGNDILDCLHTIGRFSVVSDDVDTLLGVVAW